MFHSGKIIAATISAALYTAPTLAFDVQGTAGSRLNAQEITEFNSPWAMDFLPSGDLLVSTKPGRLFLVQQNGQKSEISGVPKVADKGQGGLGDIVVHPDFSANNWVYISYAEEARGVAGAAVDRAKLDLTTLALTNRERIWTQSEKTSGRGHYSHRIIFGPKDGAHAGKIFITSGDRQKMSPAQDINSDLGKIIRLNEDGSTPNDNPFTQNTRAQTFWSVGHRNMLGIDFDQNGNLWAHEMGPRHGDELNLIERGQNYGWPIVSEGNHYNGTNIPNHDTDARFMAPKAAWVPSIAPSGFVIYQGASFPDWQGHGFIGGLVSQALIRVDMTANTASEAERFEWGSRIRDVEEGPDGALWVLEDRRGGRLLRLMPR